MSSPMDLEKHNKCVNEASQALYTTAASSALALGAGWYAAGMYWPKVAAVNWRAKGIGSAVTVIAFSYYRAERALIDCTQEYAERAKEKEQRHRQKLREQAALAAQQQQQ